MITVLDFENRRAVLSWVSLVPPVVNHTLLLTMQMLFDTLHQQRFILQPILAEHNVNLVGIGFDDLGVKDFISGNFFKGGIIML